MTDQLICTRCGRDGHRASHCPWPATGIQACMGGWCARRNECEHYLSEQRHNPAERLCLPGNDGVRDDVPVVVRRPVGTWERSMAGVRLLAAASPFPEAV